MTDVFISYKREERPVAEALARVLKEHGFSVWWDIELLPGDRFSREIRQILSRARAAVVVWSDAAVESDFVLDEAALARSRGILVPVRIDDCQLPMGFGQHHVLDLRGWDRAQAHAPEIEGLVRALRRLVPAPAAVEAGAATTGASAQADTTLDEARHWKQIADRRRPSAQDYADHLERFGPQGVFAELAQARLAELRAASGPGARRRLAAAGALAGLATVGSLVYWARPHPEPEPEPDPSAGTAAGPRPARPAPAASEAAAPSPSPPPPERQAALPTPAPPAPRTAPVTRRPPVVSDAPPPATPPAPPAPARPGAPSPSLPSQADTPAPPTSALMAPPRAPIFVREVEFNLRYAAAAQARADAVLAWLSAQRVEARTTRLYTVPGGVANRIYYHSEHADAARWLQAGLRDKVPLELTPFDSTDDEARRQVRIVIGPAP
ncbi:MAG: toll/interleukin-1 receptor domain-containing protein [Rubrivivax sp.]|nr:toll/interleukin-1 receptor domain-containing protein [Rubrivivax sp.]